MHDSFRLAFTSGPLEVRRALGKLRRWMMQQDLKEAAQGTVELVLGEVLNNVVEHAYGDDHAGEIELCCAWIDRTLHFEIADRGREMSGLRLPVGHPAPLDCARNELPEGGFGWFLVHSLARDLQDRRYAGSNRLGFSIPVSD